VNVVGFAGSSGAGKTTLIESLIRQIRQAGQRVSVVKHAHHTFEIDKPGKDTWRHREAGAFEVVAASPDRLFLVREFERRAELSVHHLIAELYDGVDWVLVEGFKDANLPKVEVWTSGGVSSPLFELDPFVVAVATDVPAKLEGATGLPVFDRNDAAGLAEWLMAQGNRFDYDPGIFD